MQLRFELYSEIDITLIMLLENRIINNISFYQMAEILGMSINDYLKVEEGIRNLNENQWKVVFNKFSISKVTRKDFFDTYFKLNK